MKAFPVSSFTTYSNRHQKVLSNEVDVATAYDIEGGGSPDFKKYLSIWDTGATRTSITKRVVAECGLKAIGITQIRGVNATRLANLYLVNLRLPSSVEFVKWKVVGIEGLSGDAEVLIGMDIIGMGDFAVSNYQGRTTFTFRMPSQGEISFTPPDPAH